MFVLSYDVTFGFKCDCCCRRPLSAPGTTCPISSSLVCIQMTCLILPSVVCSVMAVCCVHPILSDIVLRSLIREHSVCCRRTFSEPKASLMCLPSVVYTLTVLTVIYDRGRYKGHLDCYRRPCCARRPSCLVMPSVVSPTPSRRSLQPVRRVLLPSRVCI